VPTATTAKPWYLHTYRTFARTMRVRAWRFYHTAWPYRFFYEDYSSELWWDNGVLPPLFIAITRHDSPDSISPYHFDRLFALLTTSYSNFVKSDVMNRHDKHYSRTLVNLVKTNCVWLTFRFKSISMEYHRIQWFILLHYFFVLSLLITVYNRRL